MKVGEWTMCTGCNRKADVCMCRTTLPANFDEIKQIKEPSTAEELRRIATEKHNLKLMAAANNLVNQVLSSSRDFANKGLFEYVFYSQGNYSKEELKTTMKLLETRGFKCTLTQAETQYHHLDDLLTVNWK